jgi:hypothetical protein
MLVGDLVLNSLESIKRLVESGYALQTLYDLMSENNLSSGSVTELEDVVNLLEIHECEVRRLRQSLSLRLRQYALESYLEELKQRAELIC